MIILDFLFNVCYAPFHKAIKGGRLGALFSLTPSVTFILMGLINVIYYQVLGSITLSFGPTLLGIGMLMLFVFIYFVLHWVYIKNNREVSKIRYPVLYGLFLPIFFIGSIIFFVFTVSKFG